jgi:hypothetical protein
MSWPKATARYDTQNPPVWCPRAVPPVDCGKWPWQALPLAACRALHVACSIVVQGTPTHPAFLSLPISLTCTAKSRREPSYSEAMRRCQAWFYLCLSAFSSTPRIFRLVPPLLLRSPLSSFSSSSSRCRCRRCRRYRRCRRCVSSLS